MRGNSKVQKKQWLLFSGQAIALIAAVVLSIMCVKNGDSLFHVVLSVVFFLVCFGMGVSLWFMKTRWDTLMLFQSIISLLWFVWGTGHSEIENLLCLGIYAVSLLLCVRVLNQFFGRSRLRWMSRGEERTLYGSIAAAMMFAAFAPHTANAARLAMLIVGAATLFAVFCTFRILRRYRNAAYQPLLQTLLLGLVFAFFPNLGLSVFPSIFSDQLIFSQLAGIFTMILPLLIFYIIVFRHFIDISYFMTRVCYCAAIAAPMAALLGALFYILNQWDLMTFDVNGLDSYRFSAVVFVVLFAALYIKKYLDYSLRKRLYPKRLDFQASLNRLLQWMRSTSDRSEIGRILSREMEASLPVEGVSLVQHTRNETDVMCSEDSKQEELGKMATNQDGFRILLARSVKTKVALTGKWKMPRRRLNPDERAWLDALINYAQIVIENLTNTQDMLDNLEEASAPSTSLPLTIKKMMLRISERERWKLSRRLHDQNMQDQLDVARQLDVWAAETEDAQNKALMVNIRERILDSIFVLRQVINDLHPEFIYRTGLRKALIDLFDKANLRADFTLRWSIDEHLDGFQHDWEMAVYRIVQELLNNAQKHSRARLVTLDLRKKDGRFLLAYADDGIGMDVSGIGYSFGTMGFPGMIGRVEGLGGQAAIESEKGKGVSIVIQWADKERDCS
ncbi:hypothetical protein M3N64_10965 [Sporolactobacillus sp. CPB3-1]|uniref:Histidine kinase/HSP90-like ATPase domain-containing protein n=1 Tax=Sporolactobacillus mangiferae TaxID=2940498 RepID=A0ABT0MC40_9BACL|nr:ATP-binding protein [Sporolactobacillus mangiferae]MCL1632439.1 hypothetical protein [Sporolactobacillus mangiferae]